MQMWSLVACGRLADGDQAALASRLAALLPEFGCDHSSLVIGPGPSEPVHLPGELVPAPAAA